MPFVHLLAELLPADLPNRDTVILKSTRHLEMIIETNLQFNLTRIVDAREAVIKHVVDSVIPWRWFAQATEVLDVGTGPGFPGIPLAMALPGVQWTLIEATSKKARFVHAVALELGLTNVAVMPRRAEEVLRGRVNTLMTARAVAPLNKCLEWIGPAIRVGGRALLYKGPDASAEISKANEALRKYAGRARVVEQYSLPDGLGSRTLVEIGHGRASG